MSIRSRLAASSSLLLSLAVVLGGCSTIRDVSGAAEYRTHIGKEYPLADEQCLYRAEKYQYTVIPISLGHLPFVCEPDYRSEGTRFEPIELLRAGTNVKIQKVYRERDGSGHVWIIYIGTVWSRELGRIVEFEYLGGLLYSRNPRPLPWVVGLPTQTTDFGLPSR